MPNEQPQPTCELCCRTGLKLTKHHLIPRKRHRRRSAQERFDREEMRSRIAMLCQPCHSTVHATLSEAELEASYHTIDALKQHPDIAKFITWAKKQPTDRRIAVKKPNNQ